MPVTLRSRRVRRGCAALALVVLAPLTACANDDDPLASSSGSSSASTAETPTESAAPAADSFPVTIEQSVGNVTIPSAPSRVVALDFPSADASIALGVIPVGMQNITYVEGGVQEWTKEALGTNPVPELIDQDNGFPFEQIAALDPDVILATNTYPLITENWSQLNAIAPVVGHVDEAGGDDWQDGFRKIARALGKTTDGDRLLAEAESVITQTKRDHPEFLGRTASFFNFVPNDGLYVISSNDDVSMRFIRDLGFAGAPTSVTALNNSGTPVSARALISAERYSVIDADVLLGTSTDPAALDELENSDLFQRVPAVARGSFLGFGIGPATAMAFPSILSVQYAVRELIDDLADAVRADETAGASASPTSS
ncbi:iron-siderophore ABC transporter substrate-binding protein [Sporichthya brevicatena]|uniref:Iron-siderophore ABC transporter substrate-binding protein n=1 Tax=Sporichthya brevicatena TaxID=171442 RepID=A0ABN1GUK2_9ACTN